MDQREKTVKKNYVYKGKIINVRRDDALLPDGRPCVREIVEHPGEVILELPAGKKEKGEQPAATALRELSEETGLLAESVSFVAEIYPTPGYTDERLFLYRAEGVTEGTSHPDDGEFVSVEWYTPQEAADMIKSGIIKDAKTVVLVLSCYKFDN